MLTNIDAVIFDLDGTLVDSMWLWPSVDEAFLNKYQLQQPENFHESMEGKSYTEVATYFRDIFSLPMSIDEIQQEWLKMTYDKYTKEVPLKSGVLEFLDTLKSLGIKMGIATSNTRVLVEATLEALGIASYFSVIRTSCEVAASKPAPDVYLKVAEELYVSPENCLVFEDVPNGIMAGKSAGMTVCAIEDDFSKPQIELKKKLADFYIQTYYDIKNKTYEVL